MKKLSQPAHPPALRFIYSGRAALFLAEFSPACVQQVVPRNECLSSLKHTRLWVKSDFKYPLVARDHSVGFMEAVDLQFKDSSLVGFSKILFFFEKVDVMYKNVTLLVWKWY